MRLATLPEALELARTHDIPNVDEDEDFWTGDRYVFNNQFHADVVRDSALFAGPVPTDAATTMETVCVTTPTN